MIFVLILICIGVAIGLLVPYQFTAAVSSIYFSVGILAAIDSILGGLKASYENKFDILIFVSGFVVNIILAMLLSWLGDNLGVPLYYAAIFVFGTRLFNNMASIRRLIIERFRK